jgi:hypothetical protein
MPPPPELAEVQVGLDVLISVTDLSGKPEPRAPPPLERLKAGAESSSGGMPSLCGEQEEEEKRGLSACRYIPTGIRSQA